MINFPELETLKIDDFGLYPGNKRNPGLNITFKPGLSLVLGANGLGKTTLITILYRLLAGPFDIPALTGRGDLGNASLEPAAISGGARATFASRVTDGAQDATARLECKIGSAAVIIERRLRDLTLTEFTVDGASLGLNEKGVFHPKIAELVGLWSFGDWILLLRHLVFYFEDRRALVWDTSAQRQLLRFLLLSPQTAQEWTQEERSILELDSRMRNLRFAAYREEQALSEVETKLKSSASVRQELRTLEQLQAKDLARREALDQESVELESRRQHAQLRQLRSQQERESRFRAFERAKLLAVEARFPKHSDSAKYILEQLFAEGECLVCGSHAIAAAEEMQRRISSDECVVCGTDLANLDEVIPAASVADRRVRRAERAFSEILPEVEEATTAFKELDGRFRNLTGGIAELDAAIAERSLTIDSLIARLPPSEQEIHKQRGELASMRSRVETLTIELSEKREAFSRFVEQQNREIAKQSQSIMKAFSQAARGFLLETANLVWAPQGARIGQSGEPIQFPAFELDMTGTDFPSPVRRSGPDHVSESQREFIDLAFRMALMEVASAGGTSLIIDAPESSLDAVFVTRAADVLARFAKSARGNRLVVTSNLIEGDLIPELLRRAAPAGDRKSRVINLFEIAEPTAAIKRLGREYSKIMKATLAKAESTKRTRVSKPRRKATR